MNIEYRVTDNVLFDPEKNDVLDGIVQRIDDGVFFGQWGRNNDGSPQRIEDSQKRYFKDGRNCVVILDIDQAIYIQENSYITGFKEIDYDRFDEMLNVLPPMRWGSYNCIEIFAMSERWSGCITDFYFHVDNKYFCKRDTLKKSCFVLAKELYEFLGTYKK
ncbi:MAG: DUF1419 domain-containing protein [Candidatus Stahlbacteria bacterium]|nr:MAG: DUF1419 domain-containing protein [Candidatus Stahlbacteria bacterium]